MGVIDDFSVVKRFVTGKNDLESAKTGAQPWMIQENAPCVRSHGSAFAGGHFK